MRLFFIFLLAIGCASCSPSFIIEPLDEGDSRIFISYGGPLVDAYSIKPIPAPLFAFGYAKGLEHKLTFHNTFYLSSITYGVLQTELGVVKGLRAYKRDNLWMPGISSDIKLNIATDFFESQLKIWPQIDFNAYWKIGQSESLVYLGVENWFEMYDHILDNGPGQAHWKLFPHAGLHFTSKLDMKWILEFKYHTPYSDGQPESNVNYRIFSSNKVLGFFVGFSKAF